MRKLSLLLISVFLVVATFFNYALAAPDIRGDYSGSYAAVVSNCMNSSDNGTYNATLEMSIPTQSANTFSGTATGTVYIGNSALIGGWFYNPGTLAESGVLTILDDTNYMFVVDGEPDAGGGRGMERGTYTWDSSSGAFTATAISKTLGDWGVSSLGQMTVFINGNTLNVTDSAKEPFSLTKIVSATNPIVGSWFFNPGSLANSAVLTFIDDTNYMFAVDGNPDDGGGRGMERGTYTWNPSSGAFTASAISGAAGDWGVSYLADPTASINGSTLTIIDSNDGPIPLTKIETDGVTAEEYIQLSGTITETGQISGNTSHTF